jgi:GxxExxY protein
MEEHFKHHDVTDLIIKAFYIVYNTLGYGFSEKVYENAMILELRRMGLKVVQQAPIRVYSASHSCLRAPHDWQEQAAGV